MEQLTEVAKLREENKQLVEQLVYIVRQVNKITFHRYVMSYSDSYFGEPQGMLKVTTRELEYLINKLPDEIKEKAKLL